MNQQLSANNLLDESAVRDWISSVLPGNPEVIELVAVHNLKDWGVTARFAVSTTHELNEVVFKACLLSLFDYAPFTYELLTRHFPTSVPQLLAWDEHQRQTWTLFRPFLGETVKSQNSLESLLKLARTMARIQVAITELPAAETKFLPRTPVECIPTFLNEIIQDINNKYGAIWHEKGTLAKQYNSPSELLERLTFFQPKLVEWAAKLKSIGCPDSIDHVDLHSENAVLQTNDNILIYDWEEAIISHPFLSLDRLLEDALEFGESGQIAVRQAYLSEIPWSTRERRERAFDLAMCLSPIKFAYECKVFDEALGREKGNPQLAAWCMMRALQRWESLESRGVGV